MCRVDNHSLLGFVIDDEVGVVVALPRPFGNTLVSSCSQSRQQLPKHIHMGIDWICIVRAVAGYDTVSAINVAAGPGSVNAGLQRQRTS